MYLKLITVMKYGLRVIYFPMKKLIRKQKKIVYLSRQSNEKQLDMQLLEREIARQYPEYKQVFRLRMMKSSLVSGIRYVFWLLGDMMQIAGASVVVCDTYSIPISVLNHRSSIKIIQMWHALGAIKKFGWQSVGKDEGRRREISEILQMHDNYNYVLAPSRATGEFYAEAFRVTPDKIHICALPHVDEILNKKNRKEEFYMDYPEYQNKKMVLYLPTFRTKEDCIITSLQKVFDQDIEIFLLTSLHPLSKARGKKKYKDYSTIDLIKIADYVITDYSSCAIDASLLKKPLYFYTPDYQSYEVKRGLNVDLKKEIGKYVFEDPKKLYHSLKYDTYDYTQVEKFCNKYVEMTENCTKNIAQFICNQFDEPKEKYRISKNF